MSPHRPVAAALAAAFVFASLAVVPAAAAAVHAPGPRIVAVYPNPVAPDDAGEYVTVAGLGGESCTLVGSHGRVALPVPANASGRVTYGSAPNRTRRLVSTPVVGVALPRLGNAGGRLVLLCGGTAVDAVVYRDAPEGDAYVDGTWRPLGRTDFRVRSVRNASTTVFALPDDPGVPLALLRNASHRVLLGGYTFSSPRVADALEADADRGVRVGVLVEGGPVGGVSADEARVLDGLAATPNVSVGVLDGPHEPYRFHHAKYAVADDAAFVTSENWDPSGIGGHRTRGWGAVVRNATLAGDLAAVYDADAGWVDAVPWRRYRRNATFQPSSPTNATYPTAFRPLTADADRVSLVVSPDDSRPALVGFVRNATRTLDVEQMTLGNDTVLLNTTVAAAERGVRVRVLLDGAWYDRARNRAVADRLNARARDEGLDLRARVADPRGRYGHVHVKGAVADGRRVLVGSVNWDRNAVRNNRETELVIADPAVGRYYGRLFRADWRGGVWTLPLPIAALAVLASLCAAWYLWRSLDVENGSTEGWSP